MRRSTRLSQLQKEKKLREGMYKEEEENEYSTETTTRIAYKQDSDYIPKDEDEIDCAPKEPEESFDNEDINEASSESVVEEDSSDEDGKRHKKPLSLKNNKKKRKHDTEVIKEEGKEEGPSKKQKRKKGKRNMKVFSAQSLTGGLLKECFDYFDIRGEGKIIKSDIRGFALEHGIKLTDEDLQLMMDYVKHVTSTDTKFINFKKFETLINHLNTEPRK